MLRCPRCGSSDITTDHTAYSEPWFICKSCGNESDLYPSKSDTPEWFIGEAYENKHIEKMQQRVNNLNKELDKAYTELISYKKIIGVN